MARSKVGWLMGSALLLAAACEAEQSAPVDDCSDGSCRDPRSTGCQAWREATCAYLGRCGEGRPQCVDDYRAIACAVEDQADFCAEKLDVAACGAVPEECRPKTVAQTQVAVAACKSWQHEVCASAARCGLADMMSCLSVPEHDCTRALGLRGSFPQCIEELQRNRCDIWAPPDACKEAVVLGEI